MHILTVHKKQYHGILLDTPCDGNDRCQECGGVCCNSFANIEISWEEYERLQELGAKRLQLSLYGHHILDIEYGCEFLVDGRCSIYEARPDICRRFICTTP